MFPDALLTLGGDQLPDRACCSQQIPEPVDKAPLESHDSFEMGSSLSIPFNNLGVGAILGLLGCGPGVVARRKAEGKDDVVVFHLQGKPDHLFEPLTTNINETRLLQALASPPATLSSQGEISPYLSSSWGWSDDYTSFTIVVRDDFRWSDGEPVTAYDLALTWHLLWQEAMKSKKSYLVEEMVAPPVVSGDSVTWQFHEVKDTGDREKIMLGLNPTPLHILRKIFDVRESDLSAQAALDQVADRANEADLIQSDYDTRSFVSSGAFRIVEWQPDHLRYVLEPNPEFSPAGFAPAQLDELIFVTGQEPETRVGNYAKGELHVFDAPPEQIQTALTKHPGTQIVIDRYSEVAGVVLNLHDPQYLPSEQRAHPIFGDLKVRQALARAVPYDGLIERNWSFTNADGDSVPMAARAAGVIRPDEYDRSEIELLPYDLDEAAALLDEAGWRFVDGSPWRQNSDGQILEFTIVLNSTSQLSKDLFALFQGRLLTIGVKVSSESLEKKAKQDRQFAREFDAVIGSLVLPLQPLPQLWADPAVQKYNYSGYHDSQVDQWIEEYEVATDREDRRELLGKISRRVYEQQPWLFGLWLHNTYVVHPDIRGAEFYLGNTDFRLWSIE